MKTIWKFPLPVDDGFAVVMPRGAELLTVQTQLGAPMLWALVEPTERQVRRNFALRGTGHPCPELTGEKYIGTFQVQGGHLVFHVFDLGEA